MGFIFQAYNLLPALSAYENVALPLRLAGSKPRRSEIRAVLDRVGLGDLGRRRPAELSGGQQQQVAVARALVTRPDVLFADEPTGALDTSTSRQILGLLRHAKVHDGQTVVMVTHDPSAAAYADVVVFLEDGQVAGSLRGGTATEIAAAASPPSPPYPPREWRKISVSGVDRARSCATRLRNCATRVGD